MWSWLPSDGQVTVADLANLHWLSPANLLYCLLAKKINYLENSIEKRSPEKSVGMIKNAKYAIYSERSKVLDPFCLRREEGENFTTGW